MARLTYQFCKIWFVSFFLETWSVCNIHQGRIELKLLSGYCCWSELYLISVEESVSCGCYFIGSPRRINLLNLMCLPTKIQPDINKEQVLKFNRVLEIRWYMCSKGHFFSWPEPLRINLFDFLWILLIHKYCCRKKCHDILDLARY